MFDSITRHNIFSFTSIITCLYDRPTERASKRATNHLAQYVRHGGGLLATRMPSCRFRYYHHHRLYHTCIRYRWMNLLPTSCMMCVSHRLPPPWFGLMEKSRVQKLMLVKKQWYTKVDQVEKVQNKMKNKKINWSTEHKVQHQLPHVSFFLLYWKLVGRLFVKWMLARQKCRKKREEKLLRANRQVAWNVVDVESSADSHDVFVLVCVLCPCLPSSSSSAQTNECAVLFFGALCSFIHSLFITLSSLIICLFDKFNEHTHVHTMWATNDSK